MITVILETVFLLVILKKISGQNISSDEFTWSDASVRNLGHYVLTVPEEIEYPRELESEIREFTDRRIVNDGEMPYMVAVRSFSGFYLGFKSIYYTHCGGVIIAKEKVLSAASCFMTNRKVLRVPLTRLHLVAGSVVSTDVYPPLHGEYRRINEVKTPRYYRYPRNDLALIFTDLDWIFSDKINVIAIQKIEVTSFKGPCYGVGYGWGRQLRSLDMTTLTEDECESKFFTRQRKFVCTEKLRKGLSKGDAGGPLICKNTNDPNDKDKTGVVVGIHSVKFALQPTLHTKVAYFYQYIEDSSSNIQLSTFIFIICISLIL